MKEEINSIIAEAIETAENLALNFGMFLDSIVINVNIIHIGDQKAIHEIKGQGPNCFYIASHIMQQIQHQMPISDLDPDDFYISVEIIYGE